LSHSTHSDEKLLEASRNGSKEAFTELVKRYWHPTYQAVQAKVRSKEEAEEIVQDLFVALWVKRKTLLVTNLSHYLFVAAKHRVISHIRFRLTQQKYWAYYKAFVPHREERTEKDVAYNELVAAIEKGLERLPDKSKKVFRLNRMEGRSITEIAKLLKLSEKAIEYHLTRSLKEMRLYLKDFTLIVLFCLSG
jgi:RNA polymerase sigma-70 factor (family 1)